MSCRIKIFLTVALLCASLFSSADELEQLLEDMGADSFETRQGAYEALKNLAGKDKEQLVPFLYEHLDTSSSPEVNMRVNELLREVILFDHFGRPPGFIGIQLGAITMLIDGEQVPVVVVNRVIPDTAADRSGLKAGDIISSLEGKRTTEHELRNLRMRADQLFISRVAKKFKGDQIRLGIYKDGIERETILTLGARPDDLPTSLPRPTEEMKEAYYKKWLQDQKTGLSEKE